MLIIIYLCCVISEGKYELATQVIAVRIRCSSKSTFATVQIIESRCSCVAKTSFVQVLPTDFKLYVIVSKIIFYYI